MTELLCCLLFLAGGMGRGWGDGGQVEAERAEQDCIKDKTVIDGNGVLSPKFVRSLKLSHFLRFKKKKSTVILVLCSMMN